MAFSVLVTDPALADMHEAADFIWVESPGSERRWLANCWRAIETLEELPLRHALIPEADILGLPYRSLPLHTHRLIYRVDEQQFVVYLVRVYHGARRPLTLADV
jgi:plasmid stabilization system protein ParE